MSKANIEPQTKAENFDAIAPQKSQPILVTTSGHQLKNRIGPIGILFLLLFLAASAGTVWFYVQYADMRQQIRDFEQISDQQQAASGQGVSLLDKINQHILLPHGEQPQITTIENAKELKKQESFFEYAQDGDALVQFNSLEIIYNPVADVIVNARSRGQVAGAEIRAVQGAITIDIRNGAGIGGLAGKTSDTFKGVKEFIVQNIGNATRNDYGKTILVNLGNKDVTGLEKQFKTQAIKDLPAGERPSTADVVIILGRS